MADNRSLDEFLGAEEASDESAAPAASEAEAGDVEAAPAVAEDDDPPVEPKAETFAWSSAGGPCDRCGEAAEERWRDGDELVCPDCKVW